MRLLRERQIDAVVHMAAQTHVDASFVPDSPRLSGALAFNRDNVLGTQVVLEAVRQHWGPSAAPGAEAVAGPYRFVNVSTDEVYGETGVGDGVGVDESAPLNPTNPYAGTKAAAEMIARSYGHSFGLPIITTRSNNAFGPGQFPEKVVPRFIRQLLAGEKMTFHGELLRQAFFCLFAQMLIALLAGEGMTRRSFLYVEDCAAAIVRVLQRGELGAAYNIGGAAEFTVRDIGSMLAAKFGLAGDVELHSVRVRDRYAQAAGYPLGNRTKTERLWAATHRPFNDRRYLLNDEALRALGWVEEFDFSSGLDRTISWYKEHPRDAEIWPVPPTCALLAE